MNHDDEHRPQENTELYRSAMEHLHLPDDFEKRTLELAQKQLQQGAKKQESKNVWQNKPFYRRPAAQVCFALLLILVIGVTPAMLLSQRNASSVSAAGETASVAAYMEGGAETQQEQKSDTKLTVGAPESSSVDEAAGESANAVTENETDGVAPYMAEDTPDVGAGTPAVSDKGAGEAQQNSAAPSNSSASNDSAVPEASPAPEAAPQSPTVGDTPAPAANGRSADGGTPSPSAYFRSRPSDAVGSSYSPGVQVSSVSGTNFYFQPQSSRENGGALMLWNGTSLSSTGVSHAESLLAANGGYYYTQGNKLYKGTSLVRDFSGEALTGAHPFTLTVFGVDKGHLYLYANRSDYVWKGENPYSILRVSLDGKQEQILFSANGISAGGKIAQARLSGSSVYYCMWEGEGGFYSLNAAGGKPRWLTANHTYDPFYVWNNELIFVDTETNLCAVRTDGSSSRKLVEGRVLYQPAVRDGVVYYTLQPTDSAALNTSLYALDLASGTSRLLLTNTMAEFGTNDFCQILPASDGLFLIKSAGEVFHYNLETGVLESIA